MQAWDLTCGSVYGLDSGTGGSTAVGTGAVMQAWRCCCLRYDMTMECSLDEGGGRDSSWTSLECSSSSSSTGREQHRERSNALSEFRVWGF